MPLNLQTGGEFTPHIRYMASTSSWKMSSEGGMVDFTMTQAIFDLDNIKTGWCMIAEGQAPQWQMDPSISQMSPRPADGEWKRGFKLNVFSTALFGNEPVREFGTNATGAVMGIEALYSQYEAEKGANPGKVPVVEYQGSAPTRVGKGNTTIPKLVITKWVERPAALQGEAESAAVSHAAAAPSAAATGASEF